MSPLQFHNKIFIVKHAWHNLWEGHMTTGRINQVAFTNPRQISQNRSKSKRCQCHHNPGTWVPGRETEQVLCQILFPVNYHEDHHKNAVVIIIQSWQRSVLPTAKARPNESVSAGMNPTLQDRKNVINAPSSPWFQTFELNTWLPHSVSINQSTHLAPRW